MIVKSNHVKVAVFSNFFSPNDFHLLSEKNHRQVLYIFLVSLQKTTRNPQDNVQLRVFLLISFFVPRVNVFSDKGLE